MEVSTTEASDITGPAFRGRCSPQVSKSTPNTQSVAVSRKTATASNSAGNITVETSAKQARLGNRKTTEEAAIELMESNGKQNKHTVNVSSKRSLSTQGQEI